MAQARNLIGPHRDDMAFMLNSMDAKDYASNGEMWSLALALKMALCEVLTEKTASSPRLFWMMFLLSSIMNGVAHIMAFASHLPSGIYYRSSKNDVPEEFFEKSSLFILLMLRSCVQIGMSMSNVPSLEDFMKQSEGDRAHA